MEIGTVEIIEDLDNPERKSLGRFGQSSSGNNGGGGDNDGGDDPKADRDRSEEFQPEENSPFVPAKSRILTGFLLLVVLMTFGGIMAAYIVIATNRAVEWKPFDLPIQIWLSTVLIAGSSLVYHLGKRAVDRNDQPAAKKWFIATTVFGAAFISSQILAWFELTSRGLYLTGNPYAGFFYILTAVHVVHVLGGIVALGAILLRNLVPTNRLVEIVKRQSLAEVVGWYWHFMGILWLSIFVLLGFWK